MTPMRPDIIYIEKILPLIHEYLTRGSSDNTPVVQYLDYETLKNELNLSIGHDGVSFEEILKEIEKYLKFSVNTSHSQFFNQLFSGFNLPAFAGDVCASLTNTTMATFEASPVATLLEERAHAYEQADITVDTSSMNINEVARYICILMGQNPKG